MLNRRACFVLPLLTAFPAFGAPGVGAPGLDVSEVRLALPPGATARMAVPVRVADAGGAGVVGALDRGHLEGAVLSPLAARAAAARMGARLIALPPLADGGVPVVRRALPPGLRDAVAATLIG